MAYDSWEKCAERWGLKIPSRVTGVRVRVPPRPTQFPRHFSHFSTNPSVRNERGSKSESLS